MRKVKEPQTIMPTFTTEQVARLVQWRPRTKSEKRLHLLVLLLLDTGARISEALSIRIKDAELDNLLVVLDGKGRKQRLVPFGPELRRAIYRHIQSNQLAPHD